MLNECAEMSVATQEEMSNSIHSLGLTSSDDCETIHDSTSQSVQPLLLPDGLKDASQYQARSSGTAIWVRRSFFWGS